MPKYAYFIEIIREFHKNPKMKYDYIHRILSRVFRRLGYSIAEHPLIYTLTPLLIIGILSIGFFKLKILIDNDYLYFPINGRAVEERNAVESLFPANKSNINLFSATRVGKMGMAIFEEKNYESLLKEYIFDEIIDVHNIIHNISIVWNNKTYYYRDLCAKIPEGECFENPALTFKGKIEDIKKKKIRIKYPYEFNKATFNAVLYTYSLGKVTTDKNAYIEDVKGIRLIYPLNYSKEESNMLSTKWEEKFIETLSKIQCQHLNIYGFVGSTIDKEVNKLSETAEPLLMIAVVIMVLFAVVTCMTTDCITSKPWIGIAGCLTSSLGVAGAFGLLLLFDMFYVDINISIPFLLLGIGLDDSFVLLASWRKTNHRLSVKERMSITYSEAAVSITITSLTNFLSFCLGFTTNFRIIQIYSAYASLSILFAYLCEITFFGGILALSGYREKKSYHSIFCTQINREKYSEFSLLKLIFVGLNKEDKGLYSSNILSYYKNTIGNIITKKWAKVVIIIISIISVSYGLFCFNFIKEEMKLVDLYPYHSYAVAFDNKHKEYFTEYPHVIQVVINKPLDYSNQEVQENVMNIVKNFSDHHLMAGAEISHFWLKFYLMTLNDVRLWYSYSAYNMSNPQDFIEAFRDIFLKFPFSRRFQNDVIFNENKTEIVASRFFVVSKNITNFDLEMQLLKTIWDIADSCVYPVNVHNLWFVFYSHNLYIKQCAIQTLSTAVVLITLIFILFIPNVICVICVALTMISIEIGIIGFMSLWNVNLNIISLICLIMGTGLCIDYSSHISYAYVTSKEDSPDEKTKEALTTVGHPIFQGCISTILGISILAFSPATSILIFVKVVLLIMLLSFIYGIFIIPTYLNVWDTIWNFKKKKQKVTEEEINKGETVMI